MNLRRTQSILILLLSIISVGCVSKPAVRMESVESLEHYALFEVAPVSNDTGQTFKFDVAGELTKHIQSRLVERGYEVVAGTDSREGTLIVKSNLIAFAPGSAFKRWLMPGTGKTQATVRISLIDKSTGKLVCEMVSAEAVSGGGLYSAGADHWILETIAKGIVNEIEVRMKN